MKRCKTPRDSDEWKTTKDDARCGGAAGVRQRFDRDRSGCPLSCRLNAGRWQSIVAIGGMEMGMLPALHPLSISAIEDFYLTLEPPGIKQKPKPNKAKANKADKNTKKRRHKKQRDLKYIIAVADTRHCG